MTHVNTALNFVAGNWLSIVVLAAIVAFAAIGIKRFLSLTASEQTAKIKEWLLYAVTTAEAELGSGTGKLKLATVYDMFVSKFPIIKSLVSVKTFEAWVDEVLEEMRHLLETNENISKVVTGN